MRAAFEIALGSEHVDADAFAAADISREVLRKLEARGCIERFMAHDSSPSANRDPLSGFLVATGPQLNEGQATAVDRIRGSLGTFVIAGLSSWWPVWLSAIVVFAVMILIAVVLALFGYFRFRRLSNRENPVQSIALDVKEVRDEL